MGRKFLKSRNYHLVTGRDGHEEPWDGSATTDFRNRWDSPWRCHEDARWFVQTQTRRVWKDQEMWVFENDQKFRTCWVMLPKYLFSVDGYRLTVLGYDFLALKVKKFKNQTTSFPFMKVMTLQNFKLVSNKISFFS